MNSIDKIQLTPEQEELLPGLIDLFNSGQKEMVKLSLVQYKKQNIPFELMAGATKYEFKYLQHWLALNGQGVKVRSKHEEMDTILGIKLMTRLCLGERDIGTLPPSLGLLSSLEELDLSKNEIRELPPSFVRLTKLKYLYLSENNLGDLPLEITTIKALKVLRLCGNGISELPLAIGRLTSLEVLDLSENFLSNIPATIGNLVYLQALNLDDNQLQQIPRDIGRLQALQILGLKWLCMKELPQEIGALKELRGLNISSAISSPLPLWITELPNLERIQFYFGGMEFDFRLSKKRWSTLTPFKRTEELGMYIQVKMSAFKLAPDFLDSMFEESPT